MLKPPKLGGAEQLRLFVHELTFERSCEILDVHPNTMRRWLRGESRVPQASLQALYWLTHWGFSEAFAASHWTHQYNSFKVRQLEAEIERMKVAALPPAPAANDPQFEPPPVEAARPRPWWLQLKRYF